MASSFVYSDQELMSDAQNYRKFLFSLLKPYIRGRILEIGSGIGNVTSMALSCPADKISSYTCIEPEKSCIPSLEKLISASGIHGEIINGSFPEALPCGTGEFDLIFSYNVMEHIEEDVAAFRICNSLLAENGVLFVFVPAFMCLFGSMDRHLKHFRRYTKKDIANKLELAGFRIELMRYCNFAGFWGWFLNNRILKISSQKSSQIALFDKVILPAQQFIENIIEPPLGQNLYVVAVKGKH
ncbi:MAG: hypothetical protein A2020_04400 [Lentisphaerae bacterium GWF2_45_14]|nr:MAG: hypothetical protein A2020_04400 [Lentisphaerae bacterium GWF2_45_14]